MRRRLGSIVKDRQQRILRTLPPRSKISIALDCWTSPFSQAFMAITGYFTDADWVYREVLLGFKPVSGSHTGDKLSSVLLETLAEHEITDRVFGLTTDNASNSKTLATALQQALPDEAFITRVPCLAHVIQLSLNQLLSRIKAGSLPQEYQSLLGSCRQEALNTRILELTNIDVEDAVLSAFIVMGSSTGRRPSVRG
jgi:hypothetical protein